YGCSNQWKNGIKMHRFPRDPKRRETWEVKVRRKDWKAKDNSFLCADHFDDTQYECNRLDGLRRLKPNAVPTQFVFTPKLPVRLTKGSSTVLEPAPEPSSVSKTIPLDHPYCSTSLGIQSDHEQKDILEDIPDIKTNHEDLDQTCSALKNASSTGGTVSLETVSCEVKLKALTNKVLTLQKTLAKERREKWKVTKRTKQLEAEVSYGGL
ncbi:hypothetical protein AALO_G00259650, partial [Scomber scombrus]